MASLQAELQRLKEGGAGAPGGSGAEQQLRDAVEQLAARDQQIRGLERQLQLREERIQALQEELEALEAETGQTGGEVRHGTRLTIAKPPCSHPKHRIYLDEQKKRGKKAATEDKDGWGWGDEEEEEGGWSGDEELHHHPPPPPPQQQQQQVDEKELAVLRERLGQAGESAGGSGGSALVCTAAHPVPPAEAELLESRAEAESQRSTLEQRLEALQLEFGRLQEELVDERCVSHLPRASLHPCE